MNIYLTKKGHLWLSIKKFYKTICWNKGFFVI